MEPRLPFRPPCPPQHHPNVKDNTEVWESITPTRGHTEAWVSISPTQGATPKRGTGLRERENDTNKSTGRSGRQKAATRPNMRREEQVTV